MSGCWIVWLYDRRPLLSSLRTQLTLSWEKKGLLQTFWQHQQREIFLGLLSQVPYPTQLSLVRQGEVMITAGTMGVYSFRKLLSGNCESTQLIPVSSAGITCNRRLFYLPISPTGPVVSPAEIVPAEGRASYTQLKSVAYTFWGS